MGIKEKNMHLHNINYGGRIGNKLEEMAISLNDFYIKKVNGLTAPMDDSQTDHTLHLKNGLGKEPKSSLISNYREQNMKATKVPQDLEEPSHPSSLQER